MSLPLAVLLIAAAAEPAIRDVRPVQFPEYASYRQIEAYAPTPEAYAEAIADPSFVMERVTYRSDDLDVFAYLYRPAKPPTDRRLPVVVFNRGSYVREEGFAPEVLMLARRLAREGYVVIAPMLRGSGGAPGHDELGGADLHDVFNVVDVVKALPYADASRLFLYGESRGGIMCLMLARDGFPARAAAVFGAITDMGAFLEGNAPIRKLSETIWPGFPANEAEIVETRSAQRWPEKIQMPLLIMTGGADQGVNPLHALGLATALEKAGRPYELKVFLGERHGLAGRAAERDADAVRFFRRFDGTP
jgi:dipeptidyl aminopeptidase/acylaminoacyl peptidase